MVVAINDKFREKYVYTRAGALRMLVSRSHGPQRGDIVLVHGLIVSSSFMEPTARFLADDYRVFVPDLLGHGKSDTPQKALNIREHARILADSLTALGVENPVIVGGSYGCQVAVELANIMDVSALVFVGPTPGAVLRKSTADLLTDAIREPVDLIFRVVSEVSRIGPKKVIELLDDMVKYPFHQRLRSLNMVPTLVITGEYDPFFSPDFMDETAKQLKASRGICMPQAAHGLPFTEPEAISKFIRNFLSTTFDKKVAA